MGGRREGREGGKEGGREGGRDGRETVERNRDGVHTCAEEDLPPVEEAEGVCFDSVASPAPLPSSADMVTSDHSLKQQYIYSEYINQ